jgi:hypothetical protein
MKESPPVQRNCPLKDGIHSERQAMIDADEFLDAIGEKTTPSHAEEGSAVVQLESNRLSPEREAKRRKVEYEIDYIEIDDDDEEDKKAIGETSNSTMDESTESPNVIDLCSTPGTPISDESHPAVEPYVPMKTVCAGRKYSFTVLKLFCNRENPWVNMPLTRRTALDVWPDIGYDKPQCQGQAEMNYMPWMFANAEEIVLSD